MKEVNWQSGQMQIFIPDGRNRVILIQRVISAEFVYKEIRI